MAKYNVQEIKNKKLKQFRQKYVRQGIYLHICNNCKRSSMLINMERCVFCDA